MFGVGVLQRQSPMWNKANVLIMRLLMKGAPTQLLQYIPQVGWQVAKKEP